MARRARFPEERLHGLGESERMELLFCEAGINRDDYYPVHFKRGAILRPARRGRVAVLPESPMVTRLKDPTREPFTPPSKEP